MKRLRLEETLNFYGYYLTVINDRTGYTDRPNPVIGIVDRRSGKVIASYATRQQIKRWLINNFGERAIDSSGE